MADYVVRVEATTEEAEKKLKRVDQRVEKLEKGATIDIKLPSAAQTLNTLQQIGSATANVAKQAIQVSKALNIGPGARLNDIEDLFNIVGGGAKKTISAMEMLRKATPTNILGTAFSTASDQAANLAKRISNVGYEVFGLTQSVNILRQAFGGLFDETIGREIRLQEALLRTRTTLASTTDIAVDGKRITDPYQALLALEGPIDKTLENIRRRSLDIAGTTSEAIVQVFGVVASQVGQFGGTLKDAEDLAITFAGALGTIGMSDPMLATQEIRSILSGTIDQNSVLARSLGLTNEDIQKAKSSSEGLVAFLQRRLEAFSAGQSIAAKGFAGIVSNIAEVRQEASRSLGKPLLQPLLDALTGVYQRLQLVFDQILKIADGLGRIGATAFSGILGGIKAAPILEGFSERDQLQAFKSAESAVAEVAVRVQAAIDSVRPQIANLANEVIKAVLLIGDGLGQLAVGFAQFKFEELKIAAASITNIISLLNSSLVPALNQILSIYGSILALPVFQYLTQVNAQLQLLERIGVLPAIRLGVAFVGISESVRVVIGWIKTAAEAIRSGLITAVNTVADGIKGLGTTLTAIGKAIVGGVTQVATTIVLVVANTIKQIGVQLIQLAVAIQAQFPAFGGLAVQISSVGRSFVNIEKGAQQALAGIQRMATGAKQALGQVERAALVAADKTRNVGSIVGGFLVSNLGKLAGSLAGMVRGLVMFQIQLFLVEKLIGFVVDQITRWRRRDDEISERTKAEIALQRLSTTYADLGETASETAKRLRDANEAIISQRFDTVQKRIEELAPAYRKASKELAQLQKQLKDSSYNTSRTAPLGATMFPGVGNATDGPGVPMPVVPPGATTPGAQANAGAQARVQQLRKELEGYYRERQKLEEYYTKQQNQTRDTENVQVLARERKDIETAIGEFRKDIERELADERFRTARELAQLEQQLAEEKRRIEKAELDRRLARESEGLTGVQADLAQILGDYERGLFDAQSEAQRKQFEAVQARENLEKAIADYKFKLEEQTAKLRKRVGDYNKEVADYESAQAERRNKERLKTALRAAAIEAERFVLGPEETRKFKDAAAGAGVSSTQALSLLKTPGVIDMLGITPDGNYENVINAMLKHPRLGKILQLDQGRFLQTLDNNLLKYGEGAGRYTYNVAAAELGNQREFQRTVAPPPKLKGFQDFSRSELPGFVAERRALGDQILALQQKLSEAINSNNLKENFNQTVERLRNVSLFTDLPTLQAATQSLEDLVDEIRMLQEAADSGETKVNSVTQRLTALSRNAPRAAEQFVSSSPEFRQLSDEAKIKLGKALADTFANSLARGRPAVTPELAAAMEQLPKQTQQMIGEVIRTIVRARKRIEEVAPIIDRLERLKVGSEEFSRFLSEDKNLVRDTKLEALQGLGQLATADSPLRNRQFEAEMVNMRRMFSFQDRGLLQDNENVLLLQKMNAATKATYEELGKFEEALKNSTARMELAENLARTMSEGYKRIFTEGLRGGDIKSIFNEMLTGMQEQLVGSFLEYAMRPAMEQMKNQFLKVLQAPSAEELAQQYRDTLLKDNNVYLTDLGTKLVENTQALLANTNAIATGSTPGSNTAAPTTNAAITTPGTNPTQGNSDTLTSKAFALDQELTQTTSAVSQVRTSAVNLPQAFSSLQRNIGGLITIFSSIGMGIAGANQMKGGGTYNTLMGLAGIFGTIGSITGMFGTGGIFAAKGASSTAGLGKAAQGLNFNPQAFKMPALVPSFAGGGHTGNGSMVGGVDGKGGFMALLHPNETVVPDSPFAATRAALGAGSASDPFAATRAALAQQQENGAAMAGAVSIPSDPIRLETQVINGVEYATVAQLQEATMRAESRGAERGRALTLGALRNSVKTRRSVGM